MNKIILAFISLMVGAGMMFFACTCGLFFGTKISTGYRVALFFPASHPSIDAINDAFKESIQFGSKVPMSFSIFNGNGNRTLMRTLADEIVAADYDLIFTIGMGATMLAKEMTTKKKKNIPIVFSAVSRPVELGLIDSFESSKNHVTGVADEQDYERQFELLSLVKPEVKSILLVYNPQEGTGLEVNKEVIKNILDKKGITLQSLEVFSSGEIYNKASSAIVGADVVLVLTDNTVVSAIESLVKLCSRHGVTLFASEADSVRRGAALGCGIPQREYGVRAGKQARSILIHHKKPADLPVQKLDELMLYVNEDAAKRQNVSLDARDHDLIAYVEVIKS